MPSNRLAVAATVTNCGGPQKLPGGTRKQVRALKDRYRPKKKKQNTDRQR